MRLLQNNERGFPLIFTITVVESTIKHVFISVTKVEKIATVLGNSLIACVNVLCFYR
jgi:hypothetical protein